MNKPIDLKLFLIFLTKRMSVLGGKSLAETLNDNPSFADEAVSLIRKILDNDCITIRKKE